jgi:hypothetical protein
LRKNTVKVACMAYPRESCARAGLFCVPALKFVSSNL